MDADTLALFGSTISMAVMVVAVIVTIDTFKKAKGQLSSLAQKVSQLGQTAEFVKVQRRAASGLLDTKISRNAMQSVIKQAREITSAIIAGD